MTITGLDCYFSRELYSDKILFFFHCRFLCVQHGMSEWRNLC